MDRVRHQQADSFTQNRAERPFLTKEPPALSVRTNPSKKGLRRPKTFLWELCPPPKRGNINEM
jgi:hypothetical protein